MVAKNSSTKPVGQAATAKPSRYATPAWIEEETQILNAYRALDRWDKNAVFLLLQSLAWGSLNAELTDKKSWRQMSTLLKRPKEGA